MLGNLSDDELPASPDASPGELIRTFRTQNMFPPIDYAVRIADSLSELLSDDARRIIEVKIDDKAEITARREARENLLKEKELREPGGG